MGKMNKDLVVHSETLLKSVGRLSAIELKLILLCTTKVRRDCGYELRNRRFEISHGEFSVMVKKDNCYVSMKAAAKRLRGRYISFNEPVTDTDGNTWDAGEINIMSSCRWLDSEGLVSLTFNDEFMPLLTKLNGKYAKYLTADIGELEGHYAIILFGLLRNHLNSQGKCEKKKNLLIKVGDLRSFFELTCKYKAHKDFKKWVLDKAVDEINKKSTLLVEYSQLKKGRRIDAISFKVTDKAKPLPAKSKAAKKVQKECDAIIRAFESNKVVHLNDKLVIEISSGLVSFEDGSANLFELVKKGVAINIKQKEELFKNGGLF